MRRSSSQLGERSSGDPSLSPVGLRSPPTHLKIDISVFHSHLDLSIVSHRCKRHLLSDRFRGDDPLTLPDPSDPFEDLGEDFFSLVLGEDDLCGGGVE